MSKYLLFEGSFSCLEQQLAADLINVRRLDPYSKITVLVGSNLLALYLRRKLTHYMPLFNIHFLIFKDAVQKKKETGVISPLERRLLAARISRQADLKYFREIAGLPGFRSALASQWLELSEGGFQQWPQNAAANAELKQQKLAELGVLYNMYRQAKGDLADEGDLFRQASFSAESKLPLFVYGFYDLNYSQQMFLNKIFENIKEVNFYLPAADNWGAEYPALTHSWLLKNGFMRQNLGDSPSKAEITAFSAAGDLHEAREITREILRLIYEKRYSPDKIAVIARNDEPLRLAAEILEAAGVPVYFPAGIKISNTPEGSGALLLLELLDQEPTRDKIINFIKFAPLKYLLENEPDIAFWEYMIAKAGVLRKAEDWHRWIENLSPEEIRDEKEVDSRDAAKQITALKVYITNLLDKRRQIRESKGWNEFCILMKSFIEDLFIPSAAAEKLIAFYNKSADINELAEGAGFHNFCQLAADEIESMTDNIGSFQQGVSLLTVMEARGLEFDAVFIMKLQEKVFPVSEKSDPLLQIEDKRMLNRAGPGRLDLKNYRYREERLLFGLACAAAAKRLYLSYPRIDMDTGKPLSASHFLLEQKEKSERRPELPVNPCDAIDRRELVRCLWNISQSGVYEILNKNGNIPGLAAAAARKSGVFTEYDGIVKGAISHDTIVSSSRLEEYLECPFHYFVGSLLKVKAMPKPVETEIISSIDKGTMIHKILERTYKSLMQEYLLPLQEEHLPRAIDLMKEISAEEFMRMEKQGLAGYRILWQIEQEQIAEGLKKYLISEVLETNNWIPSDFETFFDGNEVILPGTEFGFKGKIDRLDRCGSGVRIIDYKSGKVSGSKDVLAEIGKGRNLQLAVYLLAAACRYQADIDKSYAEFIYILSDGNKKVMTGEMWPKAFEVLQQLTALFFRGTGQGMYFPNFNSSRCRSCEYSLVCGNSIYTRNYYSRKQGAPFIEEYKSFKEGS